MAGESFPTHAMMDGTGEPEDTARDLEIDAPVTPSSAAAIAGAGGARAGAGAGGTRADTAEGGAEGGAGGSGGDDGVNGTGGDDDGVELKEGVNPVLASEAFSGVKANDPASNSVTVQQNKN